MRSLVVALLLLGLPVHAALVDSGSYTTDTVSGLDWLNLDKTNGLTMSAALAANSGWRYALYTEIDNLYATAFPGIPNPADLGYTNIYDNSPQQQSSVNAFIDHFGTTGYQGTLTVSQGFYFGESGDVFFLGVQRYPNLTYSHIYMDYTELRFSDPVYTQDNVGTYLVRTSAVPIPAAVWLVGSALAGLGWLRRKPTA
jgi:hypothetical protein